MKLYVYYYYSDILMNFTEIVSKVPSNDNNRNNRKDCIKL